MDIGKIIKNYRSEHSLTLRQFGERCGVSWAYISRIERGFRPDSKLQEPISPSVAILEKLAAGMGMTLEELTCLIQDKEISKPSRAKKIPILGNVRAGVPLEAAEDIIGYEEIAADMSGEYFALIIRGDSMAPRIMEGDVAVVKVQPYVESGELAIVLVDGAATIKRVQIQSDGIMLIPYNPAYIPTHYTRQQISELPVQIIGRVVEVRAKF